MGDEFLFLFGCCLIQTMFYLFAYFVQNLLNVLRRCNFTATSISATVYCFTTFCQTMVFCLVINCTK